MDDISCRKGLNIVTIEMIMEKYKNLYDRQKQFVQQAFWGATSFAPIGDTLCTKRQLLKNFSQNILCSFEQTDSIEVSNFLFSYKRL